MDMIRCLLGGCRSRIRAVDEALAVICRLSPPTIGCRDDRAGRGFWSGGGRRRRWRSGWSRRGRRWAARRRPAGGGGGGTGRRRRGRRDCAGGRRAGARAAAGPNPNRDRNAPIVGNPIGREALLSDLKYEMISYSPEELIEPGADRAEMVRERDEKSRSRDGARATTGKRPSSTSRRCTSSPASSRP